MSKAKVSDILSEIFKKIGSKENTKEVRSSLLVPVRCQLSGLVVYPLFYCEQICQITLWIHI